MKAKPARMFDASRLVPVLLIIASFGPYIFLSAAIRVDHVLIYALFPIALGLLCVGRRSVIHYRPLLFILFLLISVTSWITVVTFAGETRYVTLMKAISHFENYFQMIALLVVLGAFLKSTSEEEIRAIFRGVCQTLILLLSLNTLVSASSLFFDTISVLQYFVGLPGQATVESSAVIERFSGIFDLPGKAGLTYSFGLFAWVYLTRHKRGASLAHYVLLGFLLVGGLLAISKMFIFGGLPLFLLYWFLSARRVHLLSGRFLLAAAAGVAIGFLLFREWQGPAIYASYFGGDPVLYYAGNLSGLDLIWHSLSVRHGDFQELRGWYGFVWREAPLQGFGFGSALILDSAYMDFFVQGGLIALLWYLTIIGTIGWVGFVGWRRGSEEGRLLAIIAIFVAAAGVGAPVINLDRFAVVFWVFVVLLGSVAWTHRRVAVINGKYGELTVPRVQAGYTESRPASAS